MSKTVMGARRTLLGLAILALGLSLSPTLTAKAQSVSEPGTPPAAEGLRSWRLERFWLRQQRQYDRLGFMFDHTQQRINDAQELIDKAHENGKDTTALQAALDAFSDAIQEARPVFESGKGIIASHRGFDANGKVTDAELAKGTIEDMSAKLKEIRDILLDPGRALRDAIRAFKEANRPK